MNVEELSASSYCLSLVIMMARTRICSGFRPQTNEFDEKDAEAECGWVRRRLVEESDTIPLPMQSSSCTGPNVKNAGVTSDVTLRNRQNHLGA